MGGSSLWGALTSLLPPPQLQEMKKLNLYQWMKLDECLMTVSLINASCSGKGPPPHPRHPLPAPGDPQHPQGTPSSLCRGAAPSLGQAEMVAGS